MQDVSTQRSLSTAEYIQVEMKPHDLLRSPPLLFIDAAMSLYQITIRFLQVVVCQHTKAVSPVVCVQVNHFLMSIDGCYKVTCKHSPSHTIHWCQYKAVSPTTQRELMVVSDCHDTVTVRWGLQTCTNEQITPHMDTP